MSISSAIKTFTKRILPRRHHHYIKKNIMPILRKVRDHFKIKGSMSDYVRLEKPNEELLRRSQETDNMILGFLKLLDMSRMPHTEVISELELINLRIQELTAQIHKIQDLLSAQPVSRQAENSKIDRIERDS